MNVKFWTYNNGALVRITLKPGQYLQHEVSRRHDEGWSSVYKRFHFDGEIVEMVIATDGTDCDGRMSSHSEYWAGLDELARYENEDGVMLPMWHQGEYSQRDYQAEAAGY